MRTRQYLDSQYAAVRSLCARGFSLMEIACELGMTYASVQHYCYKNHVKHRRESGERKPDPSPYEIAARALMVRMARNEPPVEAPERRTFRVRW